MVTLSPTLHHITVLSTEGDSMGVPKAMKTLFPVLKHCLWTSEGLPPPPTPKQNLSPCPSWEARDCHTPAHEDALGGRTARRPGSQGGGSPLSHGSHCPSEQERPIDRGGGFLPWRTGGDTHWIFWLLEARLTPARSAKESRVKERWKHFLQPFSEYGKGIGQSSNFLS